MKNIFKRINYEIFETLQLVFAYFPGTIGVYIRKFFYKLYLNKCGKNLSTGIGIRIQCPNYVSFGNNCGLNDYCWIAANSNQGGKIKFGNNVLIGPKCVFHSGNHVFKNKTKLIIEQGFIFNEIIVEDDVWIAANCTILSGVKIGKGAVVAAGSLVNRNVEPYSIVAGIPAKIISKRE